MQDTKYQNIFTFSRLSCKVSRVFTRRASYLVRICDATVSHLSSLSPASRRLEVLQGKIAKKRTLPRSFGSHKLPLFGVFSATKVSGAMSGLFQIKRFY
jgi:hypothetical protein